MVDNAAQFIAQSFKEYRYYNSHSLHTDDVICGVCRLELPNSMNVDEDIPSDIYISSYIACNQIPMHEYPIKTNYAVKDTSRNCLSWDYVLSFPIKFRELSRNAMIVITAWTPSGLALGGTCCALYDDSGCLKRGKQKNLFYMNTIADSRVVANSTRGDAYESESFNKYDFPFEMEKHLENFKCHQQSGPGPNNNMPMTAESSSAALGGKLDWLDRLTLTQLQRSLGQVPLQSSGSIAGANSLSGATGMSPNSGSIMDSFYYGTCEEECALYARCWMVLEMPLLQYPVIHEEKPYSSSQAVSVSNPITFYNNSVPNIAGGGNTATNSCVTETERGIYEFCISGKEFSPLVLTLTKDWEVDQDNIFEEQYHRMERRVLRGEGEGEGRVDRSGNSCAVLKPNIKEKEVIDKILSATGNHLEYHEKDLLYRFRYFLTENKKALTKFLLSVDWTSETEAAEVPMLLHLWSTRAPIDISDALKLLGCDKAFQRASVRGYAVEVLKKATDHELRMFLSQLVQALRYDIAMQKIAANGPNNNDLGMSQQQDGMSSDDNSNAQHHGNNKMSPLANFLIDRACVSVSLANYLYWYLKVETEDDTGLGPMFTAVLDAFLRSLKANSSVDGEKMAVQLLAADEYVADIIKCQRLGREAKGQKEMKEECFRRVLTERKLNVVPARVNAIPLPLEPELSVTGLYIPSTFMFKSALYPAVIEFILGSGEKDDSDSAVVSATSTLPPPVSEAESVTSPPIPPVPAPVVARVSRRVLFKSGDDLRQDQLIMQMFTLMDALLKNVNLDLKLLTYGILATGPADGLMEFVAGSIAVSAVMEKYNGSIAAFLKDKNPDPSEPMGISAECMDTYVRSCAGSCVISYILGIGDRHLDNVMMNAKGQLFHIDFGFIFGRDPKPFPPPFRFTRSMVDAMGGEESVHYAQFKSLCCQAYSWLRKSANLVLSLLSLMGDAGIPDMSPPLSDLPTVLAKVEERFRLDLTDEQAEQFFLGLIVETINAIAPRIMELAHQFAVARR